MTLEEIKSLYKDVFILTVDDIVGDLDETIKAFNADELLMKNELGFSEFVGLLVTLCIVKIHKPEELEHKNFDEMSELINDFYTRHIRRITKKFTSKYGISMDENSLNVSAKIVKYGKKL